MGRGGGGAASRADADRQDGAGLGLPLARCLARAADGDIVPAPSPRGAGFEIRLRPGWEPAEPVPGHGPVPLPGGAREGERRPEAAEFGEPQASRRLSRTAAAVSAASA